MLFSRFSFWPHALRSRRHQRRSVTGRRITLRPKRKNTHRHSNRLTRTDQFSQRLHHRRWSHLHLRPRPRRRQRWQREIIHTESLSPANRIWWRARIRLANISMWKDSLPGRKRRILTPTRFSLCRNASGPGLRLMRRVNTGLPHHSLFMRTSGMNIRTFGFILWNCE